MQVGKLVLQKVKISKYFGKILICFGIFLASPLSVPVKSREYSGIVSQVEIEKEAECIREALWFESRDQGLEGMKAVLSVIHNRKQAKGFPSTYCGVIHAKMQFSYRLHLPAGVGLKIHPQNSLDKEILEDISLLAHKVVTGKFKPVLEPNVLWYAHVKVKNHWTRKYKRVIVLNQHAFYKES